MDDPHTLPTATKLMAESPRRIVAGDAESEFFSPAYFEKRRRALEQAAWPQDLDAGDPKGPSGHAYAIRKSTWLTSGFRQMHRKGAMDITPQDVIALSDEAFPI